MMLEIEIPTLRRGRTQVLSSCRLSLAPAQVIGLVGPNGAGKSTLLSAIAGLSAERVRTTQDGAVLERRHIGLLPQNFAVRSALTVHDCVLLGRREDLGVTVAPDLIAEAGSLLAAVGLTGLADRTMLELSGGQQQRVLIAQRLFRKPRLLLLDEPTSALDLHHQLEVMGTLRRHALDTGTPILAALHDLTLAARFCDRVIVMAGGTFAADGPPRDVLSAECLRNHWAIQPEILISREGKAVIVPHLPGQAASARGN